MDAMGSGVATGVAPAAVMCSSAAPLVVTQTSSEPARLSRAMFAPLVVFPSRRKSLPSQRSRAPLRETYTSSGATSYTSGRASSPTCGSSLSRANWRSLPPGAQWRAIKGPPGPLPSGLKLPITNTSPVGNAASEGNHMFAVMAAGGLVVDPSTQRSPNEVANPSDPMTPPSSHACRLVWSRP